MIRTVKMLMVDRLALIYTLVLINNLIEFNSNYQFVLHVVEMGMVVPGNLSMVAYSLRLFFATHSIV